MTQPDTDTPSISPASAVLLAIAAVAATTLVGLIAAQAITHIHVYVGTAGLLAAIAAITGVGFIVDLGVERILRRVDRLEERMDQHAANLTEQGQETAASMFVANAAGSRHLSAVSDR